MEQNIDLKHNGEIILSSYNLIINPPPLSTTNNP